MKTAQEVFANAKSRIREVSAKEVLQQVEAGQQPTLLDVRELNEWNLGHIPRAVHIARGVLESNIEARIPRDANVVIYCASGNRSALAAIALEDMGYTQVASLSGGFRGWVEAGGDVAD